MNMPSKHNPKWSDVVTGKQVFDLKLLAAKIMLGRTVRALKADPSNIKEEAERLYSIYEKNIGSPVAQEDLKLMFG